MEDHQMENEMPEPTQASVDLPHGRAKQALIWLQVFATVIILCAVPGQWFVYRDRQDRTDMEVKELRDFKDRRTTEVDGKLAILTQAQSNILQYIEAQKDLNRKVEIHLADKTIHVTEDQMKNMIVAQMMPLTTSMAKLEVTVDGQQKSLTRVEDMQQRTLDILQKQQINAAAKDGR